MSDISNRLRLQVINRAGSRCEYCRLSQVGQEATFHIDHVEPRAAGGPTTSDNLALACVSCSLHKAARQLATDPETDVRVPLFNPRTQNWNEHFRWDSEMVIGVTPTGRASVAALQMNRPLAVAIRREEAAFGRHPG